MWSELLRVTDENQGFDAYRKFLTEELTNRARKVSMSKCVFNFNFNFNFITHITYIFTLSVATRKKLNAN